MMSRAIADGLIMYLALVVLLTFHEFGHAWVAKVCGDNTARDEGRVSLNPIVHMDMIGTVALPLIMIFLSPGAGLLGWARPVPVNPANLRRPRIDDILVTLAGPWMNVVLAIAILGLARVGTLAGSEGMVEICLRASHLSLLLCFFNLIPIPPLDGSQVVRTVVGMSYQAYAQFAQYGFLILIILIQIPAVTRVLYSVTDASWVAIGNLFGLNLG